MTATTTITVPTLPPVARQVARARVLKDALRKHYAAGSPEPLGWRQWADRKRMGTMGGALLAYRTESLLARYVLDDVGHLRACWEFRVSIDTLVNTLSEAVALYGPLGRSPRRTP